MPFFILEVEMLLIFMTLIKLGFVIENKEFFDAASQQMQDGASWEYVGPTDLSPGTKSIAIEGLDGKKFILFKLKK